MNLNKYIIENYEPLSIIHEYDENGENINQNKKYMCNRCFYQTNDYEFLIEHLYVNCKVINGNFNKKFIKIITVNK